MQEYARNYHLNNYQTNENVRENKNIVKKGYYKKQRMMVFMNIEKINNLSSIYWRESIRYKHKNQSILQITNSSSIYIEESIWYKDNL